MARKNETQEAAERELRRLGVPFQLVRHRKHIAVAFMTPAGPREVLLPGGPRCDDRAPKNIVAQIRRALRQHGDNQP